MGCFRYKADSFIHIYSYIVILFFLKVYIFAAMLFNYSALSFTKQFTATTRVVFANIRIILVWMIAILLKWENFHWLQLIGFTLLIIGTCVYNNLLLKNNVQKPIANCENEDQDENTSLLKT
jgi:hypothetical protein